MRTLCEHLRSNSGLLIARDVAALASDSSVPPNDELLATSGMNPLIHPDWTTFRAIEPAARFVPASAPNVFDTPERLGKLDVARDNDFFSEFARPLGAHRSLYAWAPWPRDGLVLGVAFHREETYGAFSDSERDWAQRFLPHLIRAARLRNRLHAPAIQGIETGILDRLNYGLIAVNTELSVQWMNNRAKSIVARPSSALRMDGTTLKAATTRLERDLRRSVHAVLCSPDSRAPHGFDVSSGGRLEEQRVLVAPLPQQQLALIVVDTVSRRTLSSVGELAREYNLTPAEARVVTGIASGHTVKVVARLGRVSEGTARNYLKSALAKTGSARQSLLVRTVLGRADASWDLH